MAKGLGGTAIGVPNIFLLVVGGLVVQGEPDVFPGALGIPTLKGVGAGVGNLPNMFPPAVNRFNGFCPVVGTVGLNTPPDVLGGVGVPVTPEFPVLMPLLLVLNIFVVVGLGVVNPKH